MHVHNVINFKAVSFLEQYLNAIISLFVDLVRGSQGVVHHVDQVCHYVFLFFSGFQSLI